MGFVSRGEGREEVVEVRSKRCAESRSRRTFAVKIISLCFVLRVMNSLWLILTKGDVVCLTCLLPNGTGGGKKQRQQQGQCNHSRIVAPYTGLLVLQTERSKRFVLIFGDRALKMYCLIIFYKYLSECKCQSKGYAQFRDLCTYSQVFTGCLYHLADN